MKDEIYQDIASLLKRAKIAAQLVRSVFVTFGATIAGVAQFMDFQNGSPTSWQLTGIFATICVFLGAAYSIIVDEGAPEQLERARRAVDKARDIEIEYSSAIARYGLYETDVRRASSLYLATMAMRQVLEVFASTRPSVGTLPEMMMVAVEPHLPDALGFQMHHQWTIGIYECQQAPNGIQELVLTAKRRAIDCDIKNARRWLPGTGFLGVAFTNKKAVFIENANDDQIRDIFAANGNHNPHDDERYVSYAIVPILVGPNDAVWGVAIATSNAVGHFSAKPDEGVKSSEGVRALAHMMALGIALMNG
jgi:hypothetical protein